MLFSFQGTFRLSCEHVLKSLKRGRETLLTLLEAFVYDPLVDWAVGEDTATGGLANLGTGTEKGSSSATTELTAARKQLEREVTRDTLAIRFTEIKTDWTQNRWAICILYTSCAIETELSSVLNGKPSIWTVCEVGCCRAILTGRRRRREGCRTIAVNCVEREIVSIDFPSSRSTLSLGSFYCLTRNEKD